MTLPQEVRTGVERAVGSAVSALAPLGGGCISPAARVTAADGTRYFLKWSTDKGTPPAFFMEEARSLEALRATGEVRVPAVVRATGSWLLLEWLEPGVPTRDTWTALGRALARVHRVQAESFGWPADNWVGSLPQRNPRIRSWPGFWREARLLPQLAGAYARGFFDASDRRRFDTFLERVDDVIGAGDEDGPSLLHGDLWGGNVHVTAAGEAALIDPSSAFGHREVDLAMARLFGGFQPSFFAAYAESWPSAPGAPERCAAYQLYYLLVHVNLFGGSYVAGVRSALRTAGG